MVCHWTTLQKGTCSEGRINADQNVELLEFMRFLKPIEMFGPFLNSRNISISGLVINHLENVSPQYKRSQDNMFIYLFQLLNFTINIYRLQ